MTDCTKLDEIVWSKSYPISDRSQELLAVVKQVAEEAFRHGVEQAAERFAECFPTQINKSFRFIGVQPAPAADAKLRCEYHKPRIPICEYCDRRIGERRMGQEAKNYVHGSFLGPSYPIYQVNDHGSFQYDRRSDKDRRKS